MEILDELRKKVIEMDVKAAVELTQKALDKGVQPDEILNRALIPAMRVVGEQFERGEKYIPEMMRAASAMKEAMELLHPLLTKSKMKMKGKVVIGTVEGDVHDIGLNLISTMLEGSGFKVFNLGANVPTKEFVRAAMEHEVDIVGLSALLTTSMVHMRDIIETFKEGGLRERVKVMIGGAPVTQDYADEIVADGYAPDAFSAVKLAERLIARLQ